MTPGAGFRGVWPVALRTNDAAGQALTARVMLVLAGRASGSVLDRPAARTHWYGPPSPRRTDRRGRLFLASHGDEEPLG